LIGTKDSPDIKSWDWSASTRQGGKNRNEKLFREIREEIGRFYIT